MPEIGKPFNVELRQKPKITAFCGRTPATKNRAPLCTAPRAVRQDPPHPPLVASSPLLL